MKYKSVSFADNFPVRIGVTAKWFPLVRFIESYVSEMYRGDFLEVSGLPMDCQSSLPRRPVRVFASRLQRLVIFGPCVRTRVMERSPDHILSEVERVLLSGLLTDRLWRRVSEFFDVLSATADRASAVVERAPEQFIGALNPD